MPKHIIEQKTLNYVSWFYEIEAEDEEAALEKFYQGGEEATRHYIGDASSMFDSEESVISGENWEYNYATPTT